MQWGISLEISAGNAVLTIAGLFSWPTAACSGAHSGVIRTVYHMGLTELSGGARPVIKSKDSGTRDNEEIGLAARTSATKYFVSFVKSFLDQGRGVNSVQELWL